MNDKHGYRADPEEIGRMRAEIRHTYQRKDGLCPYFLPMKIASLDEHSWIWLIQRMRPAELEMIKKWRATTSDPSPVKP